MRITQWTAKRCILSHLNDMFSQICLLPVLAFSYFREGYSFLSEIHNTNFDFFLKTAVFDCTLDALNNGIKNTKFDHYLTEFDTNDDFDNVSSFQVVKFIFNDEIDNSFGCNFGGFHIFFINVFIDLELHATNVASCHFSASIELEIRIYICLTSVTP